MGKVTKNSDFLDGTPFHIKDVRSLDKETESLLLFSLSVKYMYNKYVDVILHYQIAACFGSGWSSQLPKQVAI